MGSRFHFPVVNPDEAGTTVSRTFVSVTGSILQSIKALGEEFAGKPVCPGEGDFEVILHPYPGNINTGRRVRLRFSYTNLYLQAFKTHGVWYRFSDQYPTIVPVGMAAQYAHRYVVEDLRFESGYTHGGLEADFSKITFGKSVIKDIYVTLHDFPENEGGMQRLKKDLARTCALFGEAIRFPVVRWFFASQLKCYAGVNVSKYRWMFNTWDKVCQVIRDGPDHFKPIEGTELDSYEKVVDLVKVILHKA